MVPSTWYEDAQANPPDQGDLEELAGEYDIDHPVLADGDKEVYNRWPGLPSVVLLSPGMELVTSGSRIPFEEDIEAALPGEALFAQD